MEALVKKYFPTLVEPELVEKIVEQGELMYLNEGDIIMDVGRYIRSIPIIMQGAIKVIREDEEGNEILLYYLKRGDTCAMSLNCCIANKKSEIKAIVASDEVAMISIPAHYMDEWMFTYRSWKDFVMQTYAKRFQEMLTTIDNIAFLKMDERLLKYLKDKSTTTKTKILQTTHQDIAMELNTSREVISRLLKQLEKRGVVKLGRNKIEMVGFN